MRVFVTGGNGFIGSVVVRDLVSAGQHVVCLLRRGSRRERISHLCFDTVEGDVRDVASFRTAMQACDAAIHLAAPGGWSHDDGRTLQDVIEGGTRNLLSVAEQRPAFRLVIVSSTAAVNASDEPRVFDETARFTLSDPALGYAIAKHRAEVVAFEACQRGADVVIVNPGEVYGPNDTALGTAGNIVEFATGWPVLVADGGTGVVHVDDVAAGIIRALERGQPGERYILAGENLTIRQLAMLVLELLGRRAPIVGVPNGLARAIARVAERLHLPMPFNPSVVPYATRYWFVDSAKARRELGLTFRDARATMRSTLDWLRAQRLV
jgi:dihydroflavonol-4-reductase